MHQSPIAAGSSKLKSMACNTRRKHKHFAAIDIAYSYFFFARRA
jgi:hypothetical protein